MPFSLTRSEPEAELLTDDSERSKLILSFIHSELKFRRGAGQGQGRVDKFKLIHNGPDWMNN